MSNDPNIITLYADETEQEQAARLHALAADPDTRFFAQDDYDRPDLPDWPLPADVWVWSTGDRWLATVAGFHADDWWEGADPEDIAARPDPWFRPISDLPTTGRLEYVARDRRVVSATAIDVFNHEEDAERFWLLDAANEQNRLDAVCKAANLPMVGLVDESTGGVMAYVTTEGDYAEQLLAIINRGLDGP